jgi:hypothetical protein
MKIVSWNINRNAEAWQLLADSDYDIALLQEASPPPEGLFRDSDINPGEWQTAGIARRPWRTAIVKLSDRVDIEWIPCQPMDLAGKDDLAVSRMGTISAAKVTAPGRDPVVLFSCYAVWEYFRNSKEIFSDGSAHRIVSDISSFAWTNHRIVAAGDFNLMNRYGEHKSKYWGNRYSDVFNRFENIELTFAGPQYPNGRQAEPWPDELPKSSQDVPTYHTKAKKPVHGELLFFQ